MSRTISAPQITGISLASGDNPLTILAGGGITSGSAAIYGSTAAYWSIGNAGTLIGGGNTAAVHYGIGLTGGGAVDNATLALIEGYGFGVLMRGSGSVVNAGTIESLGTALTAFHFVPSALSPSLTAEAGGVVLTSGGISNVAGAVIAGQGIGVGLNGAGSVVNSGLITAAGTIALGVVLGGTGTVVNATGGEIVAANAGVIAAGAGLEVTNAGGITATVGVYLLSSGGVRNTGGTISASGVGIGIVGSGDVANSGRITGGRYGVMLYGSGTVVNAGTITNTQTLSGNTVNLAVGGDLTNAAGATIAGEWIGVGIGNTSIASTIVSTIINAGSIGALDSQGDGADLWLRGTAYVRNTGVISAGPFGMVLYDPTTVVNLGTIAGGGVGNEGAIVPGQAALAAADASLRLEEAPAGVLGGNVIAPLGTGGAAANTLELLAGTGIGSITGFGARYQNFGEIAIDAGAQWLVAGAASGFAAAAISGFAPGDTLELTGTVASEVALGGGLLTLSGGITLDLAGATQATVGNDGTNTFITACFASGTKLLTVSGPVAVEALREGDLLATPRGLAPIRWIGHRRTALARHRQPHDVMPVRIRAEAFAAGVPARDLILSPDHAVLVDGALVPVRHIVNGLSIVQETRETVTYWHVELGRHDIVFAEGLACETYLDTGNRGAFDAADDATELHPDFARGAAARAIWEQRGCATILTDPASPRLRAIHTGLLARARRYGSAISTITGTWSEGCGFARSARSGAAEISRSASRAESNAWSMRSPLSRSNDAA